MLKCILIDEEPATLQVFKNYIRKIPFLELSGSFSDPAAGLAFMKKIPVDLIFMDIRKSMLAGSAQLGILQFHKMVILTSESRKFSQDGFDHNAIDFLVKPVFFERFYRAAEKAYQLKSGSENANLSVHPAPMKGGYIFIKEGTRLLRIELDDIYYVMGLKNYVSISTKSHRIVSLQTMKQMEDLLPSHRFVRVHRSYFVALDKINSVEKQQVHVKDKVIPIGNLYLPVFMKLISSIRNQ